MPVSRIGTWSRSSSMPTPPLSAISTEEEVSPAAPMSWMATMASSVISSRQASSSSFSVNGAPPCLRADIDHGMADAAGGGLEDVGGVRDTHGHGIHQNVVVVARVEIG